MPHPPTTYAELKRSLRKRGSSLTQIAARLKVSLTHVVRVANGERKSPRVQDAIAEALGTQPEKLFPNRFRDAA